MKTFARVLCIHMFFAMSSVQATLVDRGGTMIFDSDLNVTWLADANYAKTAGYYIDGRMNWNQANAFITLMNGENGGVGHLGYNDWRLPTAVNFDMTCNFPWGPSYGGYGCTGSELGHLFYMELGGIGGHAIVDQHNASFDLFSNFVPSYYRSGTVNSNNVEASWVFQFNDGAQSAPDMINQFYVLPVRNGDVVSTAIPISEPSSHALVLMGFVLLGLGLRPQLRLTSAAALPLVR